MIFMINHGLRKKIIQVYKNSRHLLKKYNRVSNMRVVVAGFLAAVCAASVTKCFSDIVSYQGSLDALQINTCPEYNALNSYRNALNNFTIEIFKNAAFPGKFHLVVSPQSLWLTLAGVAEGADSNNQQKLFQRLNLPNDPCLRQKIFQIAASRFTSSPDVSLVSTRALVIDEGVKINAKWHNLVSRHSLIEVITAPLKRDPAAAVNLIRQRMAANFPKLNIQGKSVLLDTVDYNGLWTTAFSDAIVKRAPFYSASGQQIGAVDLMKVKRHARLGYLSSLQSKLIELPIGKNGQYSMIIALIRDIDLILVNIQNMQGSIIPEMVAALKDSEVPINVAIPRFGLKSELDLKSILQDLGITKLWTDPAATRFISDPPPLPNNYVQRTSVTLNSVGTNSPLLIDPRSLGPPTPRFWREFIADRPFIFEAQLPSMKAECVSRMQDSITILSDRVSIRLKCSSEGQRSIECLG